MRATLAPNGLSQWNHGGKTHFQILCLSLLVFVGNKAKGCIRKRVFQENKARQIFWKTNIPYPLIRTCTFVSRKWSPPNFPKKEHFLPPDTHTYVRFKKIKHGKFSAYQGVRKVRFLENLPCFVFSKHSFWDSPYLRFVFCLITDVLSLLSDIRMEIMTLQQ